MLRFGWIAVLLTTPLLIGCDQPSRPATSQGGTQTQSTTRGAETRGTEIAGILQRAKDGDSFDFRSDAGEALEVRLEGIDCPEKGQTGAAEAKRWLEDVTRRRRIWVIPTGKDKYGRTLASVHNGEIWINGEADSVRTRVALRFVQPRWSTGASADGRASCKSWYLAIGFSVAALGVSQAES